ncbi:MaoC family dehydratase [Mariniplasma anaerobium]|uniref:Dehydrogenase n=1 Tax=Mariniplasma anaerobium TaxID=2735436 RepID=A0A7U9TII8_9MOLU|nr:MaoC family dehydratase [Mariniplasma anaerobium]BCR36023.1 dehydrogenase [Mariniplasma anaerobium]
MIGKTIKELRIGDAAFFQKTITDADVVLFAGVTGDMNPVHINEVYAKESMFKKRICHGGLVAALFSTVLGTTLPGYGTIYLGQNSKFVKPVYLNDTIKATVEVVEIIESKNRVILKTTATNQNDEVVITGEATVMPPR